MAPCEPRGPCTPQAPPHPPTQREPSDSLPRPPQPSHNALLERLRPPDPPSEGGPGPRPPPQAPLHPSDGGAAPPGPQSLLEEVLSWRRTAVPGPSDGRRGRPPAPRPALLLLLLLWLAAMGVSGSEFPDRECCDNPLYKFDPDTNPRRTTFQPHRLTYSPPEVPDFPEFPDFAPPEVPPGGRGGSGENCLGVTHRCGHLFNDAYTRRAFHCCRNS